MAKARTKARSTPAAQSREEAEEAIARMGELQRKRLRLGADYGDEAAKLKADYERDLEPIDTEIAELQTAVQGWAEAHRRELTNNDKVKFAKLATGEVKWRLLPPKVNLRNVEAVVACLLGSPKLKRKFLRTKLEVNKEAMLADPTLARTVPGVTIGTEGEEFIVEPYQPDLDEVAA